jgi:hypothetical protein
VTFWSLPSFYFFFTSLVLVENSLFNINSIEQSLPLYEDSIKKKSIAKNIKKFLFSWKRIEMINKNWKKIYKSELVVLKRVGIRFISQIS